SSVRDQLRYARFHMGDGRSEDGQQVLWAESLQRMQTPVVPAAGDDLMGLGWMMDDTGGLRFVRHGGATNGQMSVFWMVPARSFALTVLTNADRGASLGEAVSTWVQEHFLGVTASDPEPLPFDAEQAAAYTGRYVEPATGQTWELLASGEGLLVQLHPGDLGAVSETPPPPPPPMPAAFYKTDRLVITGGRYKGIRGEFLRDDEGRIAWFRLGARIHRPER